MVNLLDIMSDVFECDIEDIDKDAEINEIPGWDSLNHVRLIVALNAEGLDIPTSQVAELTSFKSLSEFIEKTS